MELEEIELLNPAIQLADVDVIDKKLTYSAAVKTMSEAAKRYKLLTKEEEVFLFNKIKNKSSDTDYAKNKLFNHNLRLVFSVARRYMDKGIDLEDLINEGCIGLMVGIDKFEVGKVDKFSTYATYWIRQKVTKCLTEQSRTIRIPFHVICIIQQYFKHARFLSKQLHRLATIEEVAVIMGIEPYKLKGYITSYHQPASLDVTIDNESESNTLLTSIKNDTMSLEDDLVNKDVSKKLLHAIETLSKYEQEVLFSFLNLEGYSKESLPAICKRHRVNRVQVKECFNRSLVQLRKKLESLGINSSNLFTS